MSIGLIAFVLSCTFAFGVAGSSANGFLDWIGGDNLDNALATTEVLVAEINIMEDEIDLLVIERDNLIVERDNLLLEVGGNELLIATLNAEIIALNETIDERDLTIVDLTQQLADMSTERDWLFGQLTSANEDANEFSTSICAEIDTIKNPVRRAKFDAWCD